MNARSFNIIFILLSCCVLSMLALQGYWILNQYRQASKDFDRTVYSALEELSIKLKERKKLQTLKMTYFIQNGDTVAKTPSRSMMISTNDKVQIINRNGSVKTTRMISVEKSKNRKTFKDSVLITGHNEHINIILSGKKAKVSVNNEPKKQIESILKEEGIDKEMTELIDKMMTEIKIVDTEVDNADTLHSLINRTLVNKGLFLPFEFAIQKIKDEKKENLVHSPSFSADKPFYKTDLSSTNIIRDDNFLMLQFPKRRDFVMAGMKGSVILSVLFSLLILSIFYYVMRLIFRQKKLSEIKNDFVNNMTHELKTPIATISLALDAINNPIIRNDDSKFTDYSRILKEENQKLNAHVEKVLQIALLDKGELHLNKRQIDLTEIMNAALATFKLQIAEQRAEIHFNPSEKIIFTGDEQHLKAVFSNLIDNALKYSDMDCVIHIAIQKTDKEISIRIKDNGIGIDAENQSRIFDKFYRVQGGNLHDVKGFGLGLSYVKSIVEAHGGTIELRSELGKGSEFTLRFKTT